MAAKGKKSWAIRIPASGVDEPAHPLIIPPWLSSCSPTAASRRGRSGSGPSSQAQGMPTLTLYHGTSAVNARRIQECGFCESSGGSLGPGVYFAGRSKVKLYAYCKADGWCCGPSYSPRCAGCLYPTQASNFARDASTRGKGNGAAVVKCSVTFDDESC
jgi:hypothetical protein